MKSQSVSRIRMQKIEDRCGFGWVGLAVGLVFCWAGLFLFGCFLCVVVVWQSQTNLCVKTYDEAGFGGSNRVATPLFRGDF